MKANGKKIEKSKKYINNINYLQYFYNKFFKNNYYSNSGHGVYHYFSTGEKYDG